jgi:GR25 family glycosyltransferase involved in LPS biosynthesis
MTGGAAQKKVAILCPVRFSCFSSGITNLALNLYDYLSEFGFQVHLLNTIPSEKNWFDDCSKLASSYITHTVDTQEKYDIVIDIDATISGEKRRRLADKVVVFFRKPTILNDIESIVYPANRVPHCIDDVDAVWIYDYFSDYDIQYLKLLVPGKPISKVPFLWRPKIVEAHYKETGFQHWSVMQGNPAFAVWHPHVMESNMANNSSCIIPMVIFRQLALQKALPFQEYTIHNMEQLNNSDYFRDNIKKNTEHENLKPNFIGRQRVIDLVIQPKSLILSHIRFLPFRPFQLDALWAGIPIIHNSVLLRSIGCGLERLYYRDNEILEAIQAFKNLTEDYEKKQGVFDIKCQEEIRRVLINRFGGITDEHKNSWRTALEDINISASRSEKYSLDISIPIATAGAPSQPQQPTQQPQQPTQQPQQPTQQPQQPTQQPQQPAKTYNVLFTDMWDDLNAEYNFFLLLLNESAAAANKNIQVKGYSLDTIDCVSPDLIIFGPFGESYRLFPNIPKIHFTGENSPPIWDTNIKLNVGYSLLERSDDMYMRIPLWLLEIDWFGANLTKIVNPKPLPIDCVRIPSLQDKEKHQSRFCSFVVTNPLNPIRNESFFWLSSYKQVDSAGRLFNNVGDEIFAGRGGGGGELLKHEFLKKYKFSLCFENSSAEGYTTEKLLHAKAAGCIPIYWGDPKVMRDFNEKGFINANNIRNADDLISLVRDIDCNEEKYNAMYSEPLLDEYKFDLTRRRLSEFSRRIWMLLDESVATAIPKYIGAETTEAAKKMATNRGEYENSIAVAPLSPLSPPSIKVTTQDISHKMNNMVLVTFATQRFLPSLQLWLNIFNQHKNHISSLQGHVYLGADISNEVKSALEAANTSVIFRRLPTESIDIPNFPDFWEAQHFAWKIWLLNDFASSGVFTDKLIFYMDVGCLYVKIPFKYITEVVQNGISLLEDPRQINRHWCSRDCCNAMKITEAEKASPQIWAGSIMFVGGSPPAKKLFSEALVWAKERHVIVGPKWEGVGSDGKHFGHRHDQSILSILSQRDSLSRFPLDEVYCDFSLRRTIRTGCSLYVHRGGFTQHKDFLPRIGEAHVINLKRREDRLAKFYANQPNMEGPVIVDEACDGRSLKLTPMLHRLFINNDFHWKKAILGCAMSHLRLWHALANEEDCIENYLIMEDDVKFKPGWDKLWGQAVEHIPEDYDVLYLGGILPPNRAGYDNVIEQINPYWSHIKEHTMFGQVVPNRYFHVCNYSYILSKAGAKKILNKIIASGGYYTSADHMVCNQIDFMKHYFLTPFVATSYQDDDPKYANSQFNDFNRIDTFDSDLWNNDERFSHEDRENVPFDVQDPSFEKAIEDAFTKTNVIGGQPLEAAKKELTSVQNKMRNEVNSVKDERMTHLRFIYCINPHTPKPNQIMELQWITDLLGQDEGRTFGHASKIVTNDVKYIDINCEALPENKPIFFVQRPHLHLYTQLFQRYEAEGKDFYVLHLSDEYSTDDISFYSYSHCKGVVRNYVRNGLGENVVVIPLGYAKRSHQIINNPAIQTPSLPFRELVWSFRGTGWNGRSEKVDTLKGVGEYSCTYYAEWKDPNQAGREEYIGEVLNSKFIPCPGGMNPETFRFYEALELGAIPLYVREPGDDLYFKKITETIPILSINSWGDAANFIRYMLANLDTLDKYRTIVLDGWIKTKKFRGEEMRKILGYT